MTQSFSVAMCTFNGERYLREQLESLAAQTLLPDELVICDDRSSDDTLPIIEDFSNRARFPVNVHVNEQNLGSTKNFERAITLCRGEVIALADQDDVWLPEKLATLQTEFSKNHLVSLVFSDAKIVDHDLRFAGEHMWNAIGFGQKEKTLIRQGHALDVLLPGWSVTGATMAFRATLVDLILPIPTDLPMIHDGWISVIAATVGEIRFIDSPLILYRQHGHQQIGAPRAQPKDQPADITNLEILKRAGRRANSYADLVDTIEEVKRRLTGRVLTPPVQLNLRHLQSWLKHLNARMNLPTGHLGRIPPVLKELMALRYYRHSNGVASAAKDLIYGTRSAVSSGD